jgi:hypothetical protein
VDRADIEKQLSWLRPPGARRSKSMIIKNYASPARNLVVNPERLLELLRAIERRTLELEAISCSKKDLGRRQQMTSKSDEAPDEVGTSQTAARFPQRHPLSDITRIISSCSRTV